VPPTRESLLALPPQRDLAVLPSEQELWVPFGDESVDATGSPLVERVPYRVTSPVAIRALHLVP
jgi:hypothetical protein